MLETLQLKNGLRSLLKQDRRSPVVAVQLWVDTGSAKEEKGEEGLSHFIEHLVFKSSRDFKEGEIAKEIAAHGGSMNAFTSKEHTVFHITISSQFVDKALQVLSQMLGAPLFDPKELKREAEVVIEEIKRSQDDPWSRCSDILMFQAFSQTTYGHPVLGYEKNLNQFTQKEVLKYFQQQYVTSNILLVVVGDFERATLEPKLESFFSLLKTPQKPLRELPPYREEKAYPIVKLEVDPFKEIRLQLAWKTVPLRHEDIPALDVLEELLGGGESSRLHRSLRLEKQLVHFVSSYGYHLNQKGLFIIYLSFLERQNLGAILSLLEEELLKIRTVEVEEEEIQKAIVNLQAEEVFSKESVEKMAFYFGDKQITMGDPLYMNTYFKKIREVNGDQLLKVARKYLHPQGLICTASGKEFTSQDKEELQAWTRGLEKNLEGKRPTLSTPKSSSSPSLKSLKDTDKGARQHTNNENKNKNKTESKNKLTSESREATATAGAEIGVDAEIGAGGEKVHFSKKVLSSGVQVILRKSSILPLFHIQMVWPGGTYFEKEEEQGLGNLMAQSWLLGTRKRLEKELHQSLERYAIDLDSWSGVHSMGLSIKCLSAFENQLIPLLKEVVTEPSWPEDLIEREQKLILERLKTRKENGSVLAELQFRRTLFPSHPYGFSVTGEEETVKSLTKKRIQAHWQNLLCPQSLVVALVGDFTEEKWLKTMEEISQHTATTTTPLNQERKSSVWPSCPLHPLREAKTVFTSTEGDPQQNHIFYGYHGLTLKDKRLDTLRVLKAILSGMEGRLFVELREKASLAYSVSAFQDTGRDTGSFGAYIGCSKDKKDQAISMIAKEFNKITEGSVSEDELQRAKTYLYGIYDIELQYGSYWSHCISNHVLHGFEYDHILKFKKGISKVTLQDIQALSQNIFSQKEVISIA